MLQFFESMRRMGYQLRSPNTHGPGGHTGDDEQQHRAGANAEQAGIVLDGARRTTK